MTEQLIHTHPQARDDRHCLAVQPLLRENHFVCTGFWTGSLDGWFYFAPRGNALAPLGGEDWEGAPEPWVVNPAEPGWDLGPFAECLQLGTPLIELQNAKRLSGAKTHCAHMQ